MRTEAVRRLLGKAWFVPLLLLFALLPPGCAGMAKNEVRAFVNEEAKKLDEAMAEMHDPVVDAYFGEIAREILAVTRRLDGADAEDHEPDETLDTYDYFNVKIVHDPIPNASTPGDDFAVLHTSLILRAESPDDLAYVLSHEYGHIRGAHQVHDVERRYETEIAAGIIMGAMAFAAGYVNAESQRA